MVIPQGRRAVICALLARVSPSLRIAQLGRKPKQDKGPRAVGLLELASDGKARLIPIAIMVDGKFYDASAYKASPVPFAIWGETVYEAERTGVSQGLFTVGRGPAHWKQLAGGRKVAAGRVRAREEAHTKPSQDGRRLGPPKLRRSRRSEPTPPSDPANRRTGCEGSAGRQNSSDTKTPGDTKTSRASYSHDTVIASAAVLHPSPDDLNVGRCRRSRQARATGNTTSMTRIRIGRCCHEERSRVGPRATSVIGSENITARKKAAGTGKDAENLR